MKVDSKMGQMDITRTHVEAGKSKLPTPHAPTTTDQVAVSSSAGALRQIRGPEVTDSGRIERLRDAIANGTFEIDHDRIAARMMEEER
jgi:flagellar biosynthesis anti-sigma factor FlgM